MSETKHSPVPWLTKVWEDPIIVIMNEKEFVAHTLGGNDKANGEFIVRACNSHDDLLEACKNAEVALGDLADFYVSRQDHNPSFAAGIKSVRRAVRAAIDRAKAEYPNPQGEA